MSKETKEKLSIIAKNRTRKPHTKETKEKMRLAAIERHKRDKK
jgi:hypothetical protein